MCVVGRGVAGDGEAVILIGERRSTLMKLQSKINIILLYLY